ncbi:PfkB family carbohydrate kinase [Methylobacillus gramineus]|uniref:PfkB family carbohydrate kinase n=1 Tax=Methylobacillus gramineus TaxID=755169 RepID=UPI001CFFB6F7|nr:PfkB family carbohydrate kinase [Methylobacillus gramineus]MCB5186174.1 PfkB family carbohydrate kinase [Methylobacillus gramineus]
MLAHFTQQRSQYSHQIPSVFVLGSLMIAHIFFVRRFPFPGESLAADSFHCETGGKGLNVLIGLHKLGISVDGIIPVGNTSAARSQYQQTLDDWALTSPELLELGEYNGNGVALIDNSGQNNITLYAGANALLDTSHIRARASRIAQAGITYASFEIPESTIATAFSIAKHAGRLTILNPSPFHAITPELLASTDVLIMNQTEAAAFFQTEPSIFNTADSAKAFLAKVSNKDAYPGKSMVITLGCQGVIAWLENGQTIIHPAFQTQVIDSIGAGDAFASAFIYKLLSGQSIAQALQAGCASASIVISSKGLLPHLPTKDFLDAMIQNPRYISPDTQ